MRRFAGLKIGLVALSLLASIAALPGKSFATNCPGGSTDISCYIVYNRSSTWNSNYSRSGAKSYEETWAQPQYATQTSYNGYYNYANEGGVAGGDCTNFTSQVLYRGGGMPMTTNYGSNDFSTAWYYTSTIFPPTTSGGRTSSWTGAQQFRQFWGEVNGTGGRNAYMMRKYNRQEALDHYDQIYGDLWPGDLVSYVDSTGQSLHTQVVHWYYKDQYGNPIMEMAQHSDASNPTGTWRYDLPLLQSIQSRTWAAYVVTLKMKLASN